MKKKPSMKDVGKFWWIKDGEDEEVVRIDYDKYKKGLVVLFTGWEIPALVDKFKDEVWLGEVQPFIDIDNTSHPKMSS